MQYHYKSHRYGDIFLPGAGRYHPRLALGRIWRFSGDIQRNYRHADEYILGAGESQLYRLFILVNTGFAFYLLLVENQKAVTTGPCGQVISIELHFQ